MVATVTAISSAVIALAALFVAWWTTHVQRRHSRLSVQPHLDLIYGNTSFGPLALVLVNNGVGPAVVDSFAIEVAGESVVGTHHLGMWSAAFSKVGADAPAAANAPLPGQYLAAGAKLTLIDGDVSMSPTAEAATEQARAFEATLGAVKVKIRYKSLYGEQYETQWSAKFGTEA